jgi:hypothetical protein
MKAFHLLSISALLLFVCVQDTLAQRSPANLADVPLSELLEFRVEADDHSVFGSDLDELDDLSPSSKLSAWYRQKRVRFEGYMDGTDELSNADVLQQYPVLPTVIDQEAHIYGVNYRHSNRFDLTFSVPYILQSTEHIRRLGAPFTLDSEGFGDISLTANYSAIKYGATAVILSGGITAPTGTIDAKGDTPRGKNTQLPYAMQIGSGTWDLHPGITYGTAKGLWSFGTTLDGVIRLGENDRGYSLGDSAALTLWMDRELTSRFKVGAHVRGETWGGIDGQDADVNPNIAPVADPDTYGGSKIDVGASFRVHWKEDVYENCFLEVGGALPVWQDLNGPQPKEAWEFTVGLSIGF